VTSNGLVIVGLELQGIAILLGCLSAYSIWRTLKEMSLANQASVSESLASQSIEILRYIADDPQLYEYFYKNKPLVVETPTRTKVLCSAEIMPNFLEHIFSTGRVYQLRRKRHGCVMFVITIQRVVWSGSLLPNTVTGMPMPS
jgi:hypothetical protein